VVGGTVVTNTEAFALPFERVAELQPLEGLAAAVRVGGNRRIPGGPERLHDVLRSHLIALKQPLRLIRQLLDGFLLPLLPIIREVGEDLRVHVEAACCEGHGLRVAGGGV
jgi:hypothetical protein